MTLTIHFHSYFLHLHHYMHTVLMSSSCTAVSVQKMILCSLCGRNSICYSSSRFARLVIACFISSSPFLVCNFLSLALFLLWSLLSLAAFFLSEFLVKGMVWRGLLSGKTKLSCLSMGLLPTTLMIPNKQKYAKTMHKNSNTYLKPLNTTYTAWAR